MAFSVCGLGLIAAAITIALRHGGDSLSLAALLTGVLLIVIGGTGRLPEEIGLQRISFDRPERGSSYHRAMIDVVQHELPTLSATAAEQDSLVVRGYWLDELEVPIVIIWAPDDTHELDQEALQTALQQAAAAGGIVLLTNVEDIQQVRSILRSRHGDRATVVRWRSHRDNESLRRAAQSLGSAFRHKRKARNR
ncbi:hypothetical protein E1218_25755 [Kribbella turkmenica]|uniref:Uncharacterized protein n=1 Tax=Kribbella turkmenica TaxID=2530375 RepID=A0A4V2YEB6_9ACTN|nr:hypothetical protein [Kribbella turkmenica]TDD18596.1 hypothetical protein E1218_25755 [Kribbella turkmenica]